MGRPRCSGGFLPPSNVSRRKSSPSPARTGLGQISPCCQGEADCDHHNSPAWANEWFWSVFMHNTPITIDLIHVWKLWNPEIDITAQFFSQEEHKIIYSVLKMKLVSHSSCRQTLSAWDGQCRSPESRPLYQVRQMVSINCSSLYNAHKNIF